MATMRLDQAVALAANGGFRSTRSGRSGSRARRGSLEEGTFERAFWPSYGRGDTDAIVRKADRARIGARNRSANARATGAQLSDRDSLAARLTGNHIAVLRVLGDYARNCRGRVYPALTTIAVGAGVARRTVVRALELLEQLGLVERRRRYIKIETEGPGPRVRQTSNVYRLTLPAWLTDRLPRWMTQPPLPVDERHRLDDGMRELGAMVEGLSCADAVGFHSPDDPELAAVLRRLGLAIDRESASARTALNSELTST